MAAEAPAQSRRRTDVVIVGAGDELLVELGPVLGDQYRTFSVDHAQDIAELRSRSWIGLYDATGPAADRAAFSALETTYGAQPWIILCADESAAQWQDVLARGTATTVLPRSQLGAPALTAALDKAALRLTASTIAVAQYTPAPVAETQPSSGSGAARPLLVAAAVAVVAGGSGLWWWTSSHSARPAVATLGGSRSSSAPAIVPATSAATGTGAAPVSVEDLLSQARAAFRDPGSQLPKPDVPLAGTSALELFGAVLALQPHNAEALDGLRRLQSVARLRVQSELAGGDVETAARLLAILQHSDLAPEELRTLQAAVEAARPRQLAAQVRAALAAGNLAAARQSLDQLAGLVGDRAPVPQLQREFQLHKTESDLGAAAQQVRADISAGALLEPESENARTRLLAMREVSRSSPQTLGAQHELLDALLKTAQVAIGRQDFEGARRSLKAAQDFGTPAELAPAQGALDAAISARQRAEAASAAAALAAQAAAQSASRADAAAQAAQAVLSPKPARPLQVTFPPSALARNIQGYVIVEFMLTPKGAAESPTVVESSPQGVFDRSAIAAVQAARFGTEALADPHKAQRARFRINFTLADANSPAAAPTSPTPAATSLPDATALPLLSPKPAKPLQVDYPQAAFIRHLTGYVTIEFMLNPDGSAASLHVVDSAPAGVFDKAALAAVLGATFVTRDLADPHRAQHARIRINFKPN